MLNLSLLPQPRQLTNLNGQLALANDKLIVLDAPESATLCFIATRLQQALANHAQVNWSIVAGTQVPNDQIGVRICVVPNAMAQAQGYQLTIKPTGLLIIASTAVGVFYGVLTLCQILSQCHGNLPFLYITDWPDFPQRGVMLDVSRNRVPTMATLYELIDLLATWKINQIQLYLEHTFAYRHHPVVWENASPLTGEEILAIDAYCRERFIELVPNQNSFGHMRPWLIHEPYRHLAECPDGCDTGNEEWGYFDEPFTLDPSNPGSLNLVRSMMDELLPHFTSRQFNIGGDEPVELGCGRSAEIVAEKGKGRVYIDFLLQIYQEVKARGYTMQAWGDIIMAYPELVAELPPDLITLEWGYEAHHPFAEHGAKFAESGLPFYLCPGTSSWNSLAGRTDNALVNLRVAAENGLKYGAVGYLVTDWGDNGHWQPLSVSYLGLLYGAALGWGYETNRDMNVAEALNQHVFHDTTGTMGQLVYDLGNVYLLFQPLLHNNSALFRILQTPPAQISAYESVTAARLHESLATIDRVMSTLPPPYSPPESGGGGGGRPESGGVATPHADLIRREYLWVADMLRHACYRGLWALGGCQDDTVRQKLHQQSHQLLADFAPLWLARHRPGGLADSLARLEKMRRDYE